MFAPEPTTDLALVHLIRPAEVLEHEKPPLLVLLHGIGSNERDLFSFADYLDPRCIVVAVRAPAAYELGGYSWFDIDFAHDRFVADREQALAHLQLLIRFIGEAVTRYGADPHCVYLGGFSQGAFMALLTGLSQPSLVAGIVSLSGRLVDDVDVVSLFAPKAALAGLPILMTHGVRDQIIPIEQARHTRGILQQLPVALSYHEYDMAHEVNIDSLQTVLTWVAEQLSDPWHAPEQAEQP